MWDLISTMEEEKPDDKDRPFPVLRHLVLELSAFSPLILRFVSCLSAQLHSLTLGAEDQFAAQEGGEGAERGGNAEGRRGHEGDMDERASFSLHLPLATKVEIYGINCSISLSAPHLSLLRILWWSRHSRLHLLPTCPAHLTSLFLHTDGTCPWVLHAPHLTSLHSLCTNMLPEQAACLPPEGGTGKEAWKGGGVEERAHREAEEEEVVEGVTVEAEQGDEEERVEEESSSITPPPVAEVPSADSSALPADVWMRIANAAAEREECYCSWSLVPCTEALPCVRRALSASNEPLYFEEDCQCPPSAVSLAQRIRSFAWLTKQHQSPSQFNFSLVEAPPRLVSSFPRSCLFPSISSITSLDLYFPRSLPSHPRLLFSLSQAPRLESLFIQHCDVADSKRAVPNHQCNDPVMVAEMWDMVSIMEEKNPDDTAMLFPVLRRLDLSLSACSPLILRFVSCLSSQLHSLDLAADDQFAAQEGKEGPEIGEDPWERDVDGRTSFSLHLPLATDVRLGGLNCSISLSGPRLSSLKFRWQSRHSRLLLLPTCPVHLTSLFLTIDPTCPWALHAPHLTSLHSLCTDMDPEQAACLPPGVIETVKILEWRNSMDSQSLDLSAWHGLRCLHAVGWAPVSLSVFRSAVLWPCDLEGMFFSSIGSEVVGFLESGLGGGGGGGSSGTSHGGEGTSRDRGDG
ncbi:unnamed protein product [Closterium sp. Naga37s-1]|nr:unnamed protein product [Closterium sp. Naga37s-1]